MTSPLDHTNSVRISALSHQAVPGSAVSNNPFMTSTPPPKTPRNARDVPPHQVVRTKIPRFPTAFNQTYGSLLSTDDNEADTSSSSSTSESRPSTPTRPPARQPLLWPGVPDPKRAIKEKTMAGVPSWPADLRLSLGANNWLDWSRHLLVALSMGQLDVYPLGMLARPRQSTDRASYDNWIGNDRMVLGYMRSHIFPSEAQYIAACTTSAEAYNLLRQRHEKRSGLTVIQIIQRMMQIRFDAGVNDTDAVMVVVRDLIYRAEMIGPVDYTKLALLFMMMTIRTTHPSVHEALAPDLMDGSLTLQALERRLNYFHDLRATQSLEQLAFPASLPAYSASPPSTQSSPTSPTIALPAYPPRANICPNCKRPGHSIEFCVSPGGKMEGYSTVDAVARQRALREPPSNRPSNAPTTAPPPHPYVKIDPDGTVWVNGVKYNPATRSERASVAEVEVEAAMTAADQGEYADWAVSNNSSWGDNELLDTATFLLADADSAMLIRGEPPLYLDSGASSHISCIRSDFIDLVDIEPRTITGVGNSSVSAIGLGTVVISLPETPAHITLRKVLYAPTAGVRLISISRLDDSGYRLSFSEGRCTIFDRVSGKKLAECTRNSSHLYVFPGSIIPPPSVPFPPSLSPPSPSTALAFPSLVATPDIETWHRRLRHANFRTILDMVRNEVATGMKADLSLAPPACDACIRGKQTHKPVPKSREGEKADRRLGRVYVDLTGPQSVVARSGCSYVMNIIDDFSGYHWTRLLKAKSDASRVLREWLEAAETQSGEKLCFLVTDNGELRSSEMTRWCAERGITHLFTAPYTSAQNGRVERLHRTLMNKARAMRLSCNAPLQMWDEFILTASYLSTLTASTAANGRTPYELWFGSRPSISHLREIGSRAYVLISAANPKIAARSVECVLVGYASNSKAYRCWHRESGRLVDSYHVTFVEHLNDQPRVSRRGPDAQAAPPADGDATASPSTVQSATDVDALVPSPPLDGAPLPPPLTDEETSDLPRRSTRNRVPAPSREDTNDGLVRGGATERALREVREAASRQAAARVSAKGSSTVGGAGGMPDAETAEIAYTEEAIDEVTFLVDVEDPDAPDWNDALNSSDRDKWLEGAQAELTSLREMGVYQIIPRSDVPSNRSVLRGKFVCRLKRDEAGTPVRYKVRWVAKGFQQVWGRDFSKTTSPTARLESLRVALHIAAVNDWRIEQYDVKTAFLNGILPEEERQYMEQPPGFLHPGKESHVWQLHRGLYGMRQSSRIWNRALHDSFLNWGFTRSGCEWCVYWRRSDNGDTTIVVLHVDDMAVVSSSEAEVKRFRSELEATWQITALGEPKLIVGIALRRDRANKTIMLSQTNLIDKIVSVYGQKDANPASTPIAHGAQLLNPDPQEELEAGERERLASLPYRSLVGSLMYVASGTRPDIMFAVSKLSRFLSCYREVHWQAAVRVVRYLKGTRDMELCLGGSSSAPALIGYCDSDYANDPGPEGRRSVTGYCFTLGSGMVSWSSKKQKTLADSTCAAEYMAASEAGRELVWLRTLLHELGFGSSLPTPLLCDNSAAVVLCGDQAFHNRVKHLDVKYHWIRERVENKELIVGRIPSSGNVADILTKALPIPQFTSLRGCLGVHQRRTGIRAEGECEDSNGK
jgi:transposase InsO family protein